MKQELKHLIDAYKYQDDIVGASDIWKIVKISDTIITLYNGKDYNDVEFNHFNIDYKIVKLPLSDLTKKIEMNGEKFVPSVEYNYLRFDEISNYKGGSNVLNFIMVREQNVLLELHFDIHGLIENGLAIDINTIK